ncbi:MAG TPA: hypothetical protein VGJ78_00170, partial [Vicinamibacterales bacterium]
ERLRESRSKGKENHQTYGLERQVEPLVMASEISGLGALRGYLKLGNLVTRLHVPFINLRSRHPAFIERRSPTLPTIRLSEPVAAASCDTPAQRLAPRQIEQTCEPRSTPNQGQAPFFQ